MITVGSHWETGPWRQVAREVVIDVAPEEYTDVEFHFTDREQSSRCSESAFKRTYVKVES